MQELIDRECTVVVLSRGMELRLHTMPEGIELKLFTAQRDLTSDQVGAVRFFPDGGSTGGRITLAAGDRKFDVDIDWLTGRVSILE